jgi:hypothetical protein
LKRTSKKEKKRLKDIQQLDENLANLNSNNLNYNTAAELQLAMYHIPGILFKIKI